MRLVRGMIRSPVGRRELLLFSLAVVVGAVGVAAAGPMAEVAEVVFRDDTVNGDRPPIILITIESVRADHIGPCYGYHRRTAPHICRLAEDGILFEEAYSQGSWTAIAVPSLITGQNPAVNGLFGLEDRLSRETMTVGRRLHDVGYRIVRRGATAYILEHGKPRTNRTRPTPTAGTFHWWFIREQAHGGYTPSRRFQQWVEMNASLHRILWNPPDDGDLKGFQWWKEHAWDLAGTDTIVGLYDGEILEADHRVGALIEQLKQRGLYRRSLIIVTADHGERIYTPENPGHAGWPDDRLTHIPLIIKLPGNEHAGTRIGSRVRHIDVVPTIYDYLGIDAGYPVDGRSLTPVLHGEDTGRVGYAAGKPYRLWRVWNDTASVRMLSPKGACQRVGRSRPGYLRQLQEMLHLVLSGERPAKRLEEELCIRYQEGIERREEQGSVVQGEMSPELREKLRQLGYVQ